ncbi:MAG: Serine/threonine-protein phosphatase 2A activator 1 [Thelocarpon superellum]|nr:MAG: Serine/threonine-protein phosphatase 2A activator 1 [Thelocarpon superellum]
MAASHASQQSPATFPQLQVLDRQTPRSFAVPAKKIHDGGDVTHFLSSRAYHDIMTFVFQLNGAMYPRLVTEQDGHDRIQPWEIGSSKVVFSDTVTRLRGLLQKLEDLVEEAPPDPGPRRFGNVSFRRWCETLEARVAELLSTHLPPVVLSFRSEGDEGVDAQAELSSYLLGSFGSAQRLDYGTGHELSFLAFLGSVWMLGGFAAAEAGSEERGIVLGVIEPYLHLVRRLIRTYNLEPAGSHGVWGLDDHSFLPYIFGSAQLCPAITSLDHIPAEGSLPGAANAGDVATAGVVERERGRNMYFAAIGFIYDVKKGPFWEHSPILYDISGVRAGWAKINKGMIKMYNAEVLSKFPVVQHFPFGSLFRWEADPDAPAPLASTSIHTSSQPPRAKAGTSQMSAASSRIASQAGTAAPWAGAAPTAMPAPRTEGSAAARAPWLSTTVRSQTGEPGTKAPWAMDNQ